MAVLEIGREPSRRELNLFGLVLLVVAGLVGAILFWRFDAPSAARVIWILGGVVALLHYAFPFLRRPLYFGWMYATYPIGWVISHTVLAAIFYLVMTPIGVVLRAVGWDPLQRRIDRDAATYWTRDNPHREMEGYFRQY